MNRRTLLVLFTGLLVSALAQAAEPRNAAPIYMLPKDGSWVEYDGTLLEPGSKELKGRLRLSSVGTQVREGKTYRWIEIRKNWPEDAEEKTEYRKVLLDEAGFQASPTFQDQVRGVWGKKGDRGSVVSLSASRAEDFLGLGFRRGGAALREVEADEQVTVPLGKYTARHVRARGSRGERELEYHGWLTKDVPFGCARFEVREVPRTGPARTIFTAAAARSGSKAKSEVEVPSSP
jgi:hypothetical protein